MKVRKFKHKPRSRLVGRNCWRWLDPNYPKSKNGWYIVDHWEEGHDEHNSWDVFLIMRYK